MPAVTIRNLTAETHRALKVRAAQNGRSTEAEIRVILQEAVSTHASVKVGAKLAAFGKRFGGIDLRIAPKSDGHQPATFE